MAGINSAHASGLRRFLQNIPILRGLTLDRADGSLECDAQPQIGAPIVVAVHGTWARSALWARRGSPLLSAIENSWPRAGLFRFDWSGVNGHRHRLAAALKLASHLRTLAEQHPNSPIVIISHSHGGNVVAWATTKLKREATAAIYLNTPFVHVLHSARGSTDLSLKVWFWFVGFFLGVLCQALIHVILPGLPKVIEIPVVIGTAITTTLLLLWKVPGRVEQLSRHLTELCAERRKILRELVVHSVGDEPSSALGGAYIAQWLLRRSTLVVAIVITLLGYVPAIATAINDAANGRMSESPLFSGTISAVEWIRSYGAYSVTGFVLIWLLIGASAYGPLHLLLAIESSVTVTPAPTGKIDVITVPWSADDGLRHSTVYESTDVHTAIVAWLSSAIKHT
jgi:hypothetical protein